MAAADRWKRYVVGPNAEGKSAVLSDTATNVKENPGFFWRSTGWGSSEIPVNNANTDDRALEISTR